MSKPNGIDVSGWQPANITQVVSYDFAGVKITQGTGYINPYWKQQIDAVINRGKVPIAYHYANGSGVNGEVNFYLQTLGNYITKVIPALDWETSADASGRNSQFSNPMYAKQWLDEVKKRSEKASFIYGSKDSCFNAMDWSAVVKAKYPCWGAQYGSNNAIYGYQANPWQSNRPWGAFEQNVSIHQYTSNLILPGYSGRLDGNISYMTMEQLQKMASGGTVSDIVPPADTENLDKATLLEMVADVMDDKYKTDEDRRAKLGNRYDEVQAMINHIYYTDTEQLAREVWTGKYGNDPLRSRVLHHRAEEVRAAVNRVPATMKSVEEVANEIVYMKPNPWGDDPVRTKKLRDAGYDSVAVQKEVNRLLGVV